MMGKQQRPQRSLFHYGINIKGTSNNSQSVTPEGGSPVISIGCGFPVSSTGQALLESIPAQAGAGMTFFEVPLIGRVRPNHPLRKMSHIHVMFNPKTIALIGATEKKMEMGLPQEKADGIRMAGSIHDIGKLSIPAEILSKPTKLTNIQFFLIKEHSRSGYEVLKDVKPPGLDATLEESEKNRGTLYDQCCRRILSELISGKSLSDSIKCCCQSHGKCLFNQYSSPQYQTENHGGEQ